MKRFYLLMACWLALFAVAFGLSLTANTIPDIIARALFGMMLSPAANLIGIRIILGRRQARRWWLIYVFVLANCLNPAAIAHRGLRGKPL